MAFYATAFHQHIEKLHHYCIIFCKLFSSWFSLNVQWYEAKYPLHLIDTYKGIVS